MTYFEVFDASGQLVSGKAFTNHADAAEHALDSQLVEEFGECHVGIACPDHDEHENVDCPYCELKQVPFDPCDHCGLNTSHDRDCPNAPRVSRIATEYAPRLIAYNTGLGFFKP